MEHGELIFEQPAGLSHALRDGFFFVEQPAEMDLAAGDRFAKSFYHPLNPDDPFSGFQRWTPENLAPREGYFCRVEDQTEQFFLEASLWRDIFPQALCAQAAEMRAFAVDILRAVLAHLDLPRRLWDEATGGCVSYRGTYHLTFNHFRPQFRVRGLNVHKDSGWVTVLRSLEPGLEVLRQGQWAPIDPLPGMFIVNFGCAMEILTRHTAMPVAAVAHRVAEQSLSAKPDRFSYALFGDSSLDERICPGLFSYVPGNGLLFQMNFNDFVTKIVQDTYRRDTQGLY
jgi:2-oxoglutarate-Fe(II)-dependent oxygenase superfamily protein